MQSELSGVSLLFREINGSTLKRPLYLARGGERISADPDSSVQWVASSKYNKLLFGKSTVELFKVQAGLRIRAWRREFIIRATPTCITYRTQVNEPVSVLQTLRLHQGNSVGFTRRIHIGNQSPSALRLRMITVHDPTSLNFRREGDPPAEIGVNAFNRGGHVVMDDAGDTTGVRVIGASPNPSVIFMTKERQRVAELISVGELPDRTEGMSGAIIIMAQYDFELSPSASADLVVASLYNPSKLEDALIEYGRLGDPLAEGEQDWFDREAVFRCSSTTVSSSFAWSKARLLSWSGDEDLLDSIISSFARCTVEPGALALFGEKMRLLQRKDGFLPHSQNFSKRGVLETAHFVISSSTQLLAHKDRKLSRRLYPCLRKAASALASSLRDGLVVCDPSLPQGWRRRLKSGFPSGTVTEVNLIVARALKEFSSLAYSLGNGVDAAKFVEASTRILASINQKLRDTETGSLVLSIDQLGRVHREITVDQAVALSYMVSDMNTAASVVHRLMEKDFETGYGPRCVPSSNPIYYNTSYCDGQLGGYWTRGALAHTVLAYVSGYPGIGSAQLEKTAKLVETDSERLGGIPGEFPYCFDPERRIITKDGSDVVAAARFVEAVLFGELGLSIRPGEVALRPPAGSQIRWFSFHNLRLGAVGSIFVGRGADTVYAATSFPTQARDGTWALKECERLVSPAPQCEALLFHDPQQLLCVGSHSPSSQSITLGVHLRDRGLAKALSAELEELDEESGGWKPAGRVRLTERMSVKVELRPFGWKFMRFS